MRLCWIICATFLTAAAPSFSQSTLVPHNHFSNHILDRLDVLYDIPSDIHTSHRRFAREDLKRLVNTTDTTVISQADKYNLHYLYADNDLMQNHSHKKGFLNNFYKNPAHFYQLESKDFSLVLNPMLNIKTGYESEAGEFIYHNGRGLELHGTLDNKLYFYSAYMENQSNFLNYQEPFIQEFSSIRGQGNYKDYQSGVFDGINGYDYGRATAYLGIQVSNHTKLELGHDRHFIGNGIRSLLLSEEGANYFYLKFDVRFWKLQYQTLLAELSTISARYTPNNDLLPKKYMATHYLSFKPRKNMEIGFFESIIFARENHFELQYLNPVIFYRTVEFQLDSPDNVLLGIDGKWNLFRKISLYGQILLDEFRAGEIFSSEKWWGNKWGLQAGIKYFNCLGIDHLDLQVEHNRVRPYTYSHREASDAFPEFTVSNYSHNLQPLAHPLGANFTETILKVRYQPFSKLVMESRFIYTKVGRDSNANYGSDILAPDATRVAEYGVQQNQGAVSTIFMVHATLAYELFHNGFLELDLLQRKDDNAVITSFDTSHFSLGLRYNVVKRTIDY